MRNLFVYPLSLFLNYFLTLIIRNVFGTIKAAGYDEGFNSYNVFFKLHLHNLQTQRSVGNFG